MDLDVSFLTKVDAIVVRGKMNEGDVKLLPALIQQQMVTLFSFPTLLEFQFVQLRSQQ